MGSTICEGHMPDTTRAERLLSLFTSPDRAEAIAGDLTEDGISRGPIRFWVDVLGTTSALWRHAVTDAPLTVLRIVARGCALLFITSFAGVVAVGLFPQWVGSPISFVVLALIWWGGALWAGISLVGLEPKRGMVACALLALCGQASLGAFLLRALWFDQLSAQSLLFYTIALAVAAPLLAGGALARRRALCSLGILVAAITPASAQQVEWKDPAPHVTKFVTVADSVQVEVLDWGGSGPAIVLLAGLGDTGHVFDEFAPLLIPRYRVIAVTRRGHRGSTAAPNGYAFVRLAEDVVHVIDTIGLRRPVVIGHSMGGEELHILGARYAPRIAGLVYIDAAFNRADGSPDYDSVARTLPPAPRPTAADMASFATLRAFLERTQGGPAGPEAHLRARWVANTDGTIARPWVPSAAIGQAMTAEIRAAVASYHPDPIRVPAIAMYAVPKSAADMMRSWYDANDAALRERVQTLFRLGRESFERHAKWFAQLAPAGRVIEVSGAHHLFISNPREVLQQIDAFMASRTR
jgi:non-heme chloroperoxidase